LELDFQLPHPITIFCYFLSYFKVSTTKFFRLIVSMDARSKTLMDIVRAGIQALSDGSVVLPAPAFVRQPPDGVRQELSDSLLSARITEMLTRKTEPILAELADIKASQAEAIERAKAELRTELLGELAA
jgi:hypothetical protein